MHPPVGTLSFLLKPGILSIDLALQPSGHIYATLYSLCDATTIKEVINFVDAHPLGLSSAATPPNNLEGHAWCTSNSR